MTNTGSIPLLIAAHNGHIDVVRVLIGAGANLNQATTDDNRSPVFMAAQNDHVDVVIELVLSEQVCFRHAMLIGEDSWQQFCRLR